MTRERYYPEYVFTPGRGAWSREGGVPKKKRRDGGMSRGRRVDVEVERWIKSRARGPHPLRPPLERSVNPSRPSVTSRGGTPLLEEPTHPLARAFVALTRRLGLVPVGAQVVVRDEQVDLATLVDGVFVDQRGRVVLVELKCGFEGYNDVGNGRMRAPFQKFTNAPKNQHQLQLAFTRCMFERTFPEFGRVDARIVRMTDRGAHVTRIDGDLDATTRRVFSAGRRV